MNDALSFRNAERKEVPLILQFIKELAAYEKMSDQVVADEQMLEAWLFDRQKAEVIFAMEGERKWDLRRFSITFLRFWSGPGSIWRICI